MSLRDWRTRQRLSQQRLADRLGCSRRTIIRNERRDRPTNEFIGLFATTFPDDIREIIEGTGPCARDSGPS